MHPATPSANHSAAVYMLDTFAACMYTQRQVRQVVTKCWSCVQARQKLANFAVYVMRHVFDGMTSYSNLEAMSAKKWLRRIIFLETVAGKLHSRSRSPAHSGNLLYIYI